MRSYCTQNGGNCSDCALSNYGRDCRNNPANTVAYYRKQREMTQKQLAEQTGIPFRNLQRIESGDITPANMTLKNAVALADALGIDSRELL